MDIQLIERIERLAQEGKLRPTEPGESLTRFLTLFPADQLHLMTPQQYCIGDPEHRESFCWWIERGLEPRLGRYMPGTSRGHIIYRQNDGDYYQARSLSHLSLEAAVTEVARLHQVLATCSGPEQALELDDDESLCQRAGLESQLRMGDGRKLRLLSIYHPQWALPISSSGYLRHFLEQFGLAEEQIPRGAIARMLKLDEIYSQLLARRRVAIDRIQFMRALFSAELGIRPGFRPREAEEQLLGYFGDYRQPPTEKVAAFERDGRQLALQRGGNSTRLWIERAPVTELAGVSQEHYHGDRTRHSNVASQAPNLAMPNPVVKLVVHSAEALDALLADYFSNTLSEPTMTQDLTPALCHQPLNQVLFGPPGTGKTYATTELAVKICEPQWFELQKSVLDACGLRLAVKRRFDDLVEEQRVVFTTFHQSFAYEDFVEGIRAETQEGGLRYEVKPGIFKTLCQDADGTRLKPVSEVSGDLRHKRIWKMSLGNTDFEEGEQIFARCQAEELILLGWGSELDFADCGTLEQVQSHYRSRYSDEKTPQATHFINRLVNEMEVGDLVVASCGNLQFQAIGEVTGEYRCLPDDGSGYCQSRKVRWLLAFEQPKSVSQIYQRRFSQKPIYRLDSEAVNFDELQALLSTSERQPARNHVIIIDEINRGNLSRIFGELITLLEPSKRKGADDQQFVTLPYSKQRFSVPPNLYVVGTMNSTDKSLAQMDLALRRRFSFVEVLPRPELLRGVRVFDLDMALLLSTINQRIEALLDGDHQIGHSYFMGLVSLESEQERRHQLARIFRENLLPLLQEYFFDDMERIGWVLNDPAKAKEDRFINRGAEQSLTGLFPAAVAEQIQDRRFTLNSAAFDRARAYQGVVFAAEELPA